MDSSWTDWTVIGEMQIGELIVLITLGLIMLVAAVLWDERR